MDLVISTTRENPAIKRALKGKDYVYWCLSDGPRLDKGVKYDDAYFYFPESLHGVAKVMKEDLVKDHGVEKVFTISPKTKFKPVEV